MDEDRQESEREPFMNFHVLTLFPEMVEGGLRESIIGRALSKGVISLEKGGRLPLWRRGRDADAGPAGL